jgi:hypothetical protein
MKKEPERVMRLRFTESEWKLVLEAVSFIADYLALKEYPKSRSIWLDTEHFEAYEANLDSDMGKAWTEHTNKCQQIKNKVERLNKIERQLQLTFKLIDASTPEWIRTKDRFVH